MKVIVLTWGGLRVTPGKEEILEKGNLHREVQLNLQKSAPLIVPKKQLTTVKGRGGRLAKTDERSRALVMKSVALRRFND